MADFMSPGRSFTASPAYFVSTPGGDGMRVESRRLAASKTEYSDLACTFVFSIYSTTMSTQSVPIKVVNRSSWIQFTKDCTDLYTTGDGTPGSAFGEAEAGVVYDEVMASVKEDVGGADYAQFVQCISCLARHRFPKMDAPISMSHLLAHHVFSVDWSRLRSSRGDGAAVIHSASLVGASPMVSGTFDRSLSSSTSSLRHRSQVRQQLFPRTPGNGAAVGGNTFTVDRSATVALAGSGNAVDTTTVGSAAGSGNAGGHVAYDADPQPHMSGESSAVGVVGAPQPDKDDGDDDGAAGGCWWWFCCWFLTLLPLLLLLHWLAMAAMHVATGDGEDTFSGQTAYMFDGITKLNLFQAYGFAGADSGGAGGLIVVPTATEVFDSYCYNNCDKLPA